MVPPTMLTLGFALETDTSEKGLEDLVADVVADKLNVRQVAANLPEEAEEPEDRGETEELGEDETMVDDDQEEGE